MKTKFRWMSLSLKGLRHELGMGFALVLLAIMVLFGYLFPGVSSIFELKTNLFYVAILAFVIVILAFIWIRQGMISSVIALSDEAKKIAQGDYNRKIKSTRDDEIGELSEALNRMTSRIRENMEELKTFSQKTEMINEEINKRILSLSSLLHISNLISQNAKLEEIIQVGAERCLAAGKMTLCCLILKDKQTSAFVMKTIQGLQREPLIKKGMEHYKVKLGEGVLGKAILRQETVIIDKDSRETPELGEFRQMFFLRNAIVAPIIARGKIHGLLIAGHEEDNYVFQNSDKELMDLFSKQIAIAIESDILATKVEKLEIVDSLTGLFNQTFVYQRLDEEIKRAISFQRPCAFVISTIDHFKEYHDAFGDIAAENALVKVGSVLKENISAVDKAARFGDHEFALILPERNKRQAMEVADDIRKKIEHLFSEEGDKRKRLTCTAAVTENPVDGITADELITKGRHILDSAKKQGGNQIYHKLD